MAFGFPEGQELTDVKRGEDVAGIPYPHDDAVNEGHGQGNAEDEGGSRPSLLSTWMDPLRARILRFTASSPTPRPETSVTFSAVEKPGKKIRSVNFSGEVSPSPRNPRAASFTLQFFIVQTRPIVFHTQDEIPALMAGLEREERFRWLPGGLAALLVLDAVIHGVADKVDGGSTSSSVRRLSSSVSPPSSSTLSGFCIFWERSRARRDMRWKRG